jgi:sigma-B regulation protein RsbU (phosphoserine phosphatase)
MKEESAPASFRYQEALAPLVARVSEPALKRRLSQVLTLLDFNSTLNQSRELGEILDLVLYVGMGETGASWAGILMRGADDRLRPAARRGHSDPGWASLSVDAEREDWERELSSKAGAALVSPLRRSGRLLGALLLGERGEPRGPFGDEDREFAETLAVSAAASIENGRTYEALQELNRKLSFKVYQLHSLFDITRELNRSPDVQRVRDVLVTNAMGQVLTTKAILLQEGAVAIERGISLSREDRAALEAASERFQKEREDRRVAELPDPGTRERLSRLGLEILVPLRSGETQHGALLLGPRASGVALSDEDRDFLRSLASQAAAAFDHIRLSREWIEKQKIEKEMALAREIQRALLPDSDPAIEGWDIAGINIPCLTVGGDYFDYLARSSGKHWLAIADVSGKGTGPALLMASIQAGLRALAGIGEISLEDLAQRLNEIVYRSTEPNRYVTAFFSCLDCATGEIEFVNAGHCYPILLRRSGTVERLQEGGSVIGLFPELTVTSGRTTIETGDLLVMYTDGLSETRSPEGEEFQEERILAALRGMAGRSSREIVARLVAGVRVFAADAGLSDDLTLIVAQKRSQG